MANQLRGRKVQFYTLNCLELILVPCCFLLALGLLKLVLLASGKAWDVLDGCVRHWYWNATYYQNENIRAFLGTVRHVCYHSNIFQEYGPGPHFNNWPIVSDRPLQANRPLHTAACTSSFAPSGVKICGAGVVVSAKWTRNFQLIVIHKHQLIYSNSTWPPICQKSGNSQGPCPTDVPPDTSEPVAKWGKAYCVHFWSKFLWVSHVQCAVCRCRLTPGCQSYPF